MTFPHCMTRTPFLGTAPPPTLSSNSSSVLSLLRRLPSSRTVRSSPLFLHPAANLRSSLAEFTAYFNSRGLLPPLVDLNTHIQNVLKSVAASTSGETVTAIERLEDCLSSAVGSSNGVQTSYKCFTDPSGSLGNLENIFHGMFVVFFSHLFSLSKLT